jgi:hypothetical protein
MATTNRRDSDEEFARRGDAVYAKAIRPFKADDEGKFAFPGRKRKPLFPEIWRAGTQHAD